jgi:hypothetical protein
VVVAESSDTSDVLAESVSDQTEVVSDITVSDSEVELITSDRLSVTVVLGWAPIATVELDTVVEVSYSAVEVSRVTCE